MVQSKSFSDALHRLARSPVLPIRIEWVPRSSVPGNTEAHSASRPSTVMRPLPPFPEDAFGHLERQKENLRRTTRALIPPCGSNLPGDFTHREEVASRRLRVGVALTPSVTASWPLQCHGPYESTCPFCATAIRDVNVHHLLWTCPGLHQVRLWHLRATGLPSPWPSSWPTTLGAWTVSPRTPELYTRK